MVPFALKEVWESARPDVYQLVEDSRDNGLVHDFEVQTGLARKSQ